MNECSCKKCIKCCYGAPGEFGNIDEIIGCAKIKSLSIKEFCKKYLIQHKIEDIIIPAPRRDFTRGNGNYYPFSEPIKNNGKGFIVATDHKFYGYPCIFLTEDDRCFIHNTKPTECREVMGCDNKNYFYIKDSILDYWKKHQSFFNDII